jgi:O-antigen ligase
VFWLQERPIAESVRDAHSLELEIAAELGIAGLIAFGLMLGGVVAAARSALRRDAGVAAGAAAAGVAWLLHASIDWDWQLPAVTLPAVVLAGTLITLAEAPAGAISSPARSPDPAGAARSGHAPRPQDRARA